jgi:hypothetical protein
MPFEGLLPPWGIAQMPGAQMSGARPLAIRGTSRKTSRRGSIRHTR